VDINLLSVRNIKDIDFDPIKKEIESRIVRTTTDGGNDLDEFGGDYVNSLDKNGKTIKSEKEEETTWKYTFDDGVSVTLVELKDGRILNATIKKGNETLLYYGVYEVSLYVKKEDKDFGIIYEYLKHPSERLVRITEPIIDPETGEVKETLTTENGEITRKKIFKKEYRDNGTLSAIRSRTITHKGIVAETIKKFDEKGNMTYEKEDKDFDVIREVSYEYDDNGNLTLKKNEKTGEIEYKVEYDDNGNKVYESKRNGKYSNTEIKSEYDNENRLIHQITFENGELIEEVFVEYKENGSKEKKIYEPPTEIENFKIYDKDDELVYHERKTYAVGDFRYFKDLLEKPKAEVLLDNR